MEIIFHEDDFAACCKNLDKLIKNGRRYGVITQPFKENFDLLDSSVPKDLKLRYLLLHANEQLASKSKRYEKLWCSELKKHGVTCDLLNLVVQGCDNSLPEEDCTDFSDELDLIHILSCDSVEVEQGRSTLLEVLVDTPRGTTISYQWMKDGCPLSDGDNYFGASKSILCVRNTDLTVNGNYTCKLCLNDHVEHTDSVPLKVLTSPTTEFLIKAYSQKQSWNTYVNLALVKQATTGNPSKYDRSTIRGDADDIVKAKAKVEYNVCFGEFESGKFLLLEGRPGSGKTTLVQEVSKNWAQGLPILKGAKIVFLVTLRLLSRKDDAKLVDLLEACNHGLKDKESVADEIEKDKGNGVCFILDGLDEYSCEDRENTIVFHIIMKLYLEKSMVIVTSRPVATADIRYLADTHIEVLGFLKKNILRIILSSILIPLKS